MGQRILIWLLTIAVTFGAYFAINALFIEDEINIAYDTNESPELSNLRKVSKIGLDFNFDVMENNVIISKTEKEKNEFDLYENYLYSPFVLYVGNKALFPENGFVVNNPTSEFVYMDVEKDLNPILIGIENNKTWKDIGISEEVLSGNIQLVIPSKTTPWFKYVKELFLLNLGEEITEKNIQTLLDRVDNIINNCIQTESPLGTIHEATSHEGGIKQIAVIAPEFIMSQKSSFKGVCNRNKEQTYFIPVYLTKTVALNYNVLIKQDMSKSLREKLFKTLSNDNNFSSTCIRTKHKDLNINYLHSNAKSAVNILSLPDNLKNFLN